MTLPTADSRLPLPACGPEAGIALVRWTLLGAAATAMTVAVFLIVRRWLGADFAPLDSRVLLPAVVGMAAGSWLWHGAWRWLGAAAGGRRWQYELWCQALVTALALAAGLSLSPAGAPSVAVVTAWAVLIGSEAGWWGAEFYRGRRPRRAAGLWRPGTLPRLLWWPFGRRQREPASLVPALPPAELPGPAEADHSAGDEACEETLPPNVRQRMTRAVDETGAEVIYGAVRCDFAVGQRQENVHLAFCPPLDATPELSAEQVDGPAARIQTSLVQPFGAALEVRLPAPSTEPASVLIQFYASVPTGA